MRSSDLCLTGQYRSVGWVALRLVDAVIAADTVRKKYLESDQLIGLLLNNEVMVM